MNFNELESLNKLRYIGRTYQKDNKLFINFSGSGVSINVKSSVLKVIFYTDKYMDKNSCPYISIIIDDNRTDYALENEYSEIVIPLSDEKHSIQILKRTETSVSFAAITDIIVDEFLEIKEECKLNIEFYGDSLTCGYGVLCNDPLTPFTTSTESFLDSYAYLTAKNLNANYSAICVSGFPIYKSRWNLGFPVESVADMISFADYSETTTYDTANLWDNKKFIPDVVVVNLGTNDCSYFTEGQAWIDELVEKYGSFEEVLKLDKVKKELDNLEEKVISFLDSLFIKYPNSKIIWALGMLEINPHVQLAIDNAIKRYDSRNVYQLAFHSLEKSNDRGANWHPGRTMHIDASLELTNYIKDIVLGGV